MTFRSVSARRARRNRGEQGFTLVELLIVITILPLVVGAISVAVLAIFNNTSSTANSLTSSGDAQISSTRFVQDVQGANWITTNNSLNYTCAGVSGTLILSLSPDNVAGTTTAIKNIISYVEVANSGRPSSYTIYREACTGGFGSSASGSGKIVVSHNALASTALTINPVGGTTQTAAATGWAPASGASGITLTLAEPANNASSTPSASYSYTMTAVPRITGTGGASPSGSVPILPMEFVGGSCVDSSLTLNGSTINVVNQNGAVGTTAPSCPGDTKVSGLESSYPYNYGLTNPFASLAAPTTPSTSGLGAGSCSGSATITCTSGLYTTTSTGFNGGSIASNTTFNPLTTPNSGVVVFTVPVVIDKDTNVTFSGGSSLSSVTYYFEQGLTIKSSTVNFGSATYIFAPQTVSTSPPNLNNLLTADTHSTIDATTGSSGLLLYGMPGPGTMTIASGFTGNMYSPPNGPYEGIVLWDAASGTLQLGQGTGGGGGVTFNGGVYAPLAPISLQGGYNLSASFLVINNATLSGSSGTITGTG